MSIDKHFNLLYTGTTPYHLGDRYYSQDLIRDLLYSWDNTGQTAKRIIGTFPTILAGGTVTKGADWTHIDITACWGICNYSVEHPNTFAALPPSKTSSDMARLVYGVAQNELNLAGLTTPSTLDGSTNYVKLRYLEVVGNSRTRARATGTYNYEVTPSYQFYCDTVAPNDYDVVLATLVGDGASYMTINQSAYPIRSLTTTNTDLLNISKYGTQGLILTNDAGDTAHDIEIGIGSCLDSTNAFIFNLSAVLTKKIDATWAVGDDAGGIATALHPVQNTTWYYVHLIRKNADSSIDMVFDTSITAANKPAEYTYYRRIGAVLTDGSANIIKFRQQNGNEFIWNAMVQNCASLNPGTNAVLQATSCPPNFIAIVNLCLYVGNNVATYVYVTSPLDTDTAASGSLFDARAGLSTVGDSSSKNIKTDSSSRIRYRSSGDNNTVIYINTIGWIDEF